MQQQLAQQQMMMNQMMMNMMNQQHKGEKLARFGILYPGELRQGEPGAWLTFAPEKWAEPQAVVVMALHDGGRAAAQPQVFSLGAVVESEDALYAGAARSSAALLEVVVLDSDWAGLEVSSLETPVPSAAGAASADAQAVLQVGGALGAERLACQPRPRPGRPASGRARLWRGADRALGTDGAALCCAARDPAATV
jgi:hypothetical protein